jgi:anionic cell wall polymer biosynthesis LytR-Cps2A-Psr (LCP) family protein
LIAIPRDLYVEIPETFINTKINAVYAYGRKKQKENSTKLIEETVEEITGQEIDYYLNINLNLNIFLKNLI